MNKAYLLLLCLLLILIVPVAIEISRAERDELDEWPRRYVDHEYGNVCYRGRFNIDCLPIDQEGGPQP